MLRGDPFCALHIKNVTAQRSISLGADSPETGTFQERTPFSGVDAAVASATGSSFPFLKPPLQGDEIGWLADYRVLQVVGQGSMSIVFRAADMRLNRNVALKVMQPHFAADDNLRRRFMREARAMAAIKSDHVVTVYDVGSVSNLPYLAMEFLDGDSLEDYHKSVGGLPLAQVLRIGREIAQGLAAAHARGLIHRDIKPGNLWLETPTDRVKILDFGLARANTEASQLSHVGVILGTPAFMAPEQARGMTVDHRADLFSLGCVLYWLCTNERPFKGADILSVLASLATHDPQSPESIAATVPAALSELIMQLLEKDPDCRPASSQAVADILAAIERSLVRGAGGMPLVLSS